MFLTVDGWLALAGKQTIATDKVFVTLRGIDGAIQFVATRRVPRDDVRRYYNQPEMPDVGFSTAFMVENLRGAYELHIARAYKGRIEICDNLHRSIFMD